MVETEVRGKHAPDSNFAAPRAPLRLLAPLRKVASAAFTAPGHAMIKLNVGLQS